MPRVIGYVRGASAQVTTEIFDNAVPERAVRLRGRRRGRAAAGRHHRAARHPVRGPAQASSTGPTGSSAPPTRSTTRARKRRVGAAFELYQYAQGIAAERRTEPKDDIITKLITAVDGDDDKLDDHEFDLFILTLAVAGSETTRNAMSHGLLALMNNPEQMQALRDAGPQVSEAAVDEILRWATPVSNFRRTATRDIELHGVQIPKGDSVVLSYASANYDETVFADPHQFDITRSPNPHVSFGGGGVHFCLGSHLARLEIRLHVRGAARAHRRHRARTVTSSGCGPVSSTASSTCRCVRRPRSRSRRRPVWRFERFHSADPACSSSPKRLRISSSSRRISSRARLAPRQKWVPLPNPRCGLGLRRMSKRAAPSNAASSRFAEPSQTRTLSPAIMACPARVVSVVAVRRLDGEGLVQRTISSTAVGKSERSARSASS